MQSYTYFNEIEFHKNYSKSELIVATIKNITYKVQKSSRGITCPNCGNALAFYQQLQGNKLVCFVCRKISVTNSIRSVAC